MATQCAAASTRMRKEYGEKPADRCRHCCNCQSKCRGDSAKMCIGYSRTITWDEDSVACGLFNIAFNGLRPRRRMLEEMYPDKSKSSAKDCETQQISLL